MNNSFEQLEQLTSQLASLEQKRAAHSSPQTTEKYKKGHKKFIRAKAAEI